MRSRREACSAGEDDTSYSTVNASMFRSGQVDGEKRQCQRWVTKRVEKVPADEDGMQKQAGRVISV